MIFSFYSFKGGVGRTLSLVHVGIKLAATRASSGYRVLLIDMDLEAPGMDAYFPDERYKSVRGFAGLLKDYRLNGRRQEWLNENIENESFIAKVPGTENLFLMPSGIKAISGHLPSGIDSVGDDYSEEGTYLDVISGIREEIPGVQGPSRPTEGFFHDLARVLKDHFTYVLIDSRAGLADQSYASTLLLADALVLCFRLNQANIEGIEMVLGNFLIRERTCLGEPHARIIPVATPVPARSGKDIEEWIRFASKALLGRDAQTQEERDGNPTDSCVSTSFVPPIQRMFFEPAFEVGESLVFNVDGTLKEGYVAQTPAVTSFCQLADRISALNADSDAVAARAIEIRLYNEKKDYDGALEYLFKRLRLEPYEAKHWSDLDAGYSDKQEIRTKARRRLNDLIEEWRRDVREDERPQSKDLVRRLGYALWARAFCFGKDDVDAGLSAAEECLSLPFADDSLRRQAHHVCAQVIEEIVNRRHTSELLDGARHGKTLSLELANEHYSKSIELGLRNSEKNAETYLLRARNFRQLNRDVQALADYETCIREMVSKEMVDLEDIHVTLLCEEADVLTDLGWYEWGFRNYLAAMRRKPVKTVVFKKLDKVSKDLGLYAHAERISGLWEEAEPRDPTVHRMRAIRFLLKGDYERALAESRIGHLYSAKPHMRVLDAFIMVVSNRPREALEIIEPWLQDGGNYAKALYAVAGSFAGEEGVSQYIGDYSKDDWPMQVIGALAIPDRNVALRVLSCVKRDEEPLIDAAQYDLLNMVCSGLGGNDTDRQMDMILKLWSARPVLPIVLGNLPEMRILRMVAKRLELSGVMAGHCAESIHALWRMIDKAEPPRLEELPARELCMPLPSEVLESRLPSLS